MKILLSLLIACGSLLAQTTGSSQAYASGGGTAQAQTVTTPQPFTSLYAGMAVCWLPSNANSGAAPTLAVNGLTAKAITKTGTTALVANDLTATAVACVIYDGTQFQLQVPQVASAGLPQRFAGACAGAALNVGTGVGGIGILNLGMSPAVGACGVSPQPYYGQILTTSGHLQNLRVFSNATGASGDGIMTVMTYNPGTATSTATTLTCTLSNASPSACSDTTHAPAVTVGDLVWIRGFTNSTNLNGMSVAFEMTN